jgi:hypothetical protein
MKNSFSADFVISNLTLNSDGKTVTAKVKPAEEHDMIFSSAITNSFYLYFDIDSAPKIGQILEAHFRVKENM